MTDDFDTTELRVRYAERKAKFIAGAAGIGRNQNDPHRRS